MRFSVLALSLALVSSLPANANEVIAQCSLTIEGTEVWNGKCCVSADASPGSMTTDLHAESWQACLYKKKHPENENLPTYRQKCFGPWINISQDTENDAKGDNYSAYWSIEGSCHGGENFSAKRNGNVYQGDKFIFEWHEVQ